MSRWLTTSCRVASAGRLRASFDGPQRAPALFVALSRYRGTRFAQQLGLVGRCGARTLPLLLLSAGMLLAQSPGTLAGRVRDSAGQPLARVLITAHRTDAVAADATAVTGESGTFRLPALPAGRYLIRAGKPGFTTQTEQRQLRAGTTLVANFSLAAAAPAAAGALPAATVENTPLNGRDWTQLAALRPGVNSVQNESSSQGHTAQRGFGAALSIAGARPEENDYAVDGVSISDYSNGAPGSVVGATLGVDAVQRLAVLGSNYPAAVGRTGGGVISAATRSGGGAWHGSVYEFLRNSALDARNFFDATRPPFRRNQFGASIGGPVRRQRWFLFADYEGLRQSLGITHVDTVPSAAARAGQLAGGTVSVDPNVARFLRALYPLPNGPLLGSGDTGVFAVPGQQVTGENYFTTRVDARRAHDTLFATYNLDRSQVTQPDNFDGLVSTVTSRRQMLALEEQRQMGADSVNAARFGFNRAVAVDGGLSRVLQPALIDPIWSMGTGPYVGSIAVPGLTTLDGGPAAGLTSLAGSKTFAWNSFQGYDDFAWTRGLHAVQFGAALERMQSNVSIRSNSNGSFTFGSLADFLTNRPLTFEGPRPLPIDVFGTRQTRLAAYVQDTVQARPNLTLSLGLRYEMTTVPTEAHNRISNLQQLTDAAPHLGNPYFLNPTLRDFSPRLGLTWQPFAGAPVLRSGFGIFDVLPLPYEFSIITPTAYPFSQNMVATTLPAGSFPTGAFQQAAANPSLFRADYVEHHPHRNYVMQWNLSLEQQVTSDLNLTLGYLGSRSVHLPFRTDDFNTVLPTRTPQGYLYPPAATSQRLNPNFGRISGILWNADAYYEALQASVTRTLPHALQIQGAYTWGKTIDTSSASITSDQYDNSLVNMPVFDTRLDRGLSDLNVSQNFVASFTWQLPWRAGAPLSWALAGWQVGGVYKAQSGTPFTAELGGDPLGTKLSDVREVPNLLGGPGCASLVNPGNPNGYIRTQCFAFPQPANRRGNLGRNTLTGPGLSNLDFALIKNTAAHWIDAAGSLQLRTEFFNLLNRADFASPLNHLAIFDPTGMPIAGAGLITSTAQPSREIQVAVKVLW